MAPDELLVLFGEVTSEIRSRLDRLADWGLRPGSDAQHHSDLAADAIAVLALRGAGLGVLSEESGAVDLDKAVVVVVDPLDGSTNAAQGIPWYATSLCAVDADGPLAALVTNQASGEQFAAVRGGGASRDGRPIRPSAVVRLDDAIVGLSGLPPRHLGWRQFRALGAAALDLCSVACGRLDAFVDCSVDAHGVWDFLGGLLVCQEAGVPVRDRLGRELVVLDHGARRTPIAAATPELLAEIAAAWSADA